MGIFWEKLPNGKVYNKEMFKSFPKVVRVNFLLKIAIFIKSR